MRIEIWSDFTCPFCYIGKHHFEEALKRFNYADYVKVEYKSYEALQNSKIVENYKALLSEKYAVPTEYEMVREEMKRIALTAGSSYNFEHLQSVKTFDAHRLMKHALNSAKSNALLDRVLHAYFVEGAYISNHDILLQLAMDIGLNYNEVSALLTTNKYASSVRCDQIEAEQIGVDALPFYVFDEQYAVSGFQTSDVLIEILEHMWSDFCKRPQPLRQSQRSETTYCSGESCDQVKASTDWI